MDMRAAALRIMAERAAKQNRQQTGTTPIGPKREALFRAATRMNQGSHSGQMGTILSLLPNLVTSEDMVDDIIDFLGAFAECYHDEYNAGNAGTTTLRQG